MTTPAGWTLVDSQSTPELSSYIFTKTATATDPGASVTVALDSPAATSLTLSAYRNTPGVSTTTATLHIDTPDHTAPDVTVPADTWVVWFWATTSPSSLSPSDGAIPRADAHAPSGQASASSPDDGAQRAEAGTLAPGLTPDDGAATLGQVSALLADTNGPRTGLIPGPTATTDSASDHSITWALTLEPLS